MFKHVLTLGVKSVFQLQKVDVKKRIQTFLLDFNLRFLLLYSTNASTFESCYTLQ